MPAFSLKTYQSQALASLERFLVAADNTGSLPTAWAQETQRQAAADGDTGAWPTAGGCALPRRG